jgi:hypothetical protein
MTDKDIIMAICCIVSITISLITIKDTKKMDDLEKGINKLRKKINGK